MTRRTRAHEGSAAGKAHQAEPWATAISATTDEHVYVRGVAIDESIGREAFPATILRLWRGDAVEPGEAELLGACMVASVDHGPLSPSALVSRTIASTRAAPMAGLAGGILAFGELHGAVVSRAMRILATAPADSDLDEWADQVFEAERRAGRRVPGVGHRWHQRDRRAERLLEVTASVSGGSEEQAMRALAARVGRHAGNATPVNIDGALAVALTRLRVDPVYGDFLFAIARSFGLAAHFVEEQARQRPMRTIDPTVAQYDGVPIPDVGPEETST